MRVGGRCSLAVVARQPPSCASFLGPHAAKSWPWHGSHSQTASAARHLGHLPPLSALGQRHCYATNRAEYDANIRWDITPDCRIQIKYKPEDVERFAEERLRFRAEQRLRPEMQPKVDGTDTLDWQSAVKFTVSLLHIRNFFMEPFQASCMERLMGCNELLERFGIPPFEDKSLVKPLHNKDVPGEGTYIRIRMQVYWIALHLWLLHSKQYAIQEHEGVWGSALCALLTRSLFEGLYNFLRLWLQAENVPAMSVTSEIQDLMEYVFGLCLALDDAFREEAAEGTLRALAKTEAELRDGQHGLAPRVKYALWANIYSGAVQHSDPGLHELTVYLLRQRIMLEALSRSAFFMKRFDWVSLPLPEA